MPVLSPNGWLQAIEALLHSGSDVSGTEDHGQWKGRPLLAKNTMDTRAQREESDEWRDWYASVSGFLAFLQIVLILDYEPARLVCQGPVSEIELPDKCHMRTLTGINGEQGGEISTYACRGL